MTRQINGAPAGAPSDYSEMSPAEGQDTGSAVLSCAVRKGSVFFPQKRPALSEAATRQKKGRMAMNRQRRTELRTVISKLNEIAAALENIKDDEEMYFDNIPENLQSSMRAEESEEAIDSLEEAIDLVEKAAESLREI